MNVLHKGVLISVLTLLFALMLNVNISNAARIKGRFDRFGTTKNLLNQDSLRNTEAFQYYHHPNGAKITKSSHFEMEYELGRKIVFICTAEGQPRPHITWFKDGIELYAHRWLQVSEWTHGRWTGENMSVWPTTTFQLTAGDSERSTSRWTDVEGIPKIFAGLTEAL